LASLFQIADLNLSLTFKQTCLLSLRCYHQLVINVDVLIEAGLEYRPGVWRNCTNRGRGRLFEEIRYLFL